jgi:hypothetical protein
VAVYQQQFPDKQVLLAFLSKAGFTKKAREACDKQGIFRAQSLKTQ